ncbi:neutral amino acid transporter 9 isoform X2 [Pseudophryne corroboree]|uniref:neutral amino acid transporter 9 isoform X2 n=1 Tax=Pseudophryne corroboree TaxID=495146 RepID=UPI00308218A8
MVKGLLQYRPKEQPSMDGDENPLLYPSLFEECATNHFSPADARSRRPFHIEPAYITSINDDPVRVTIQASAMNKRIHYYSKLGPPSEQALIAPDHVIPAPEEIYVYSPLGTALKIGGADGTERNSSIVTIFMIWNTMMGTSILSIPWGIKQAGFTTGVIIIFLMGLLTLYCCYRVVKSRAAIHYVHHVNVTDIGLSTNGSDKVICPNTGDPTPPNATLDMTVGNSTDFEQFQMWWSKTDTVPLYLIIVLLPLLNFRSPSFFAKFNVLGTVSVLYLVSLITFKASRIGFHLNFRWNELAEYFVPEFRLSFPQLTGVLTLAFFIHNCIITLLKNNRNPENNVRDLSVAYLLVGLTYMYVGVMVFGSFPSPPLAKECIQQNFLDNFPSNDILSFVARIFLLFQMMTVYPLLGYLVRVQLLGHIFGNNYPSFFHVLGLNIAVVGFGVLMARFYPNIGGIIRFSGAACGLAFVFVYPCLIHMIALYRSQQLRWYSTITHVSIIVLGVANLVAQFLM